MEFLTRRAGEQRSNSVSAFVVLAVAAYVFVAVRPYTGVRHDGILYAAQALYRLYPDVFTQDLFFKYGSQESFSIFGRLYAFLISTAGFQPATIGLLLVSQVLFLCAVTAWARRTLGSPLWAFGVLAVALSSGTYGGEMIFRYAEPFVTARPFAEALSLFAMTALLGGAGWLSFLLLAIAAVFHPLIALPALVIWWVVHVREDKRWLWMALVLPAVAVAGGMGVHPFDDLLRAHDPEWRAALEIGNSDLFIGMWTSQDYLMLATDFALALWLRRYVGPRLSKLLDAVIFVAAVCVVVSWLGADVFSNVLLTSLQLWRAQWLLHVFSISLLPLAIFRLCSGNPAQVLAAILLIYAAINRGLVTGFVALALGLVLTIAADRKPIVVERRFVYGVAIALCVGMLALWHNNVSWTLRLEEAAGSHLTGWQIAGEYMRRPPAAPILVGGLLLLACWRIQHRFMPLIVGAICIALVLTQWDERSPAAHEVESYASGNHPFDQIVKPSDEVYWLGDALAPWLMMHRRSYVSGMQSAGQSFNRATAMEVKRRRTVLALFDFHAQICGMMNKFNGKSDSCEPDLSTIRSACEADSALSYVVTRYGMENAWLATWTPRSLKGIPGTTYHLYGCKQLLGRAS